MSTPLNRDLEIVESERNTLFDQFFRDSEGNIVIAQPPNLPLIVGLVATILQTIMPSGTWQTGVGLVAFGVWFTWAWQEIFAGVNYFRRSLGVVVLVSLIALRLNV
jgi:hypothetical protein